MSPALPSEIAAAVSDRCLKLTINTSEQCNLRCVYCYETFAAGHMSSDVAEGIVRLLERRVADGLDWLEVEFFGGEPLGSWGTVKYLTASFKELCQKHEVKLRGGITTNSILLHEDRLNWLVHHGVNAFQITLDGPQEIHDVRRVGATKVGSFAVIMKRLAMMRSSKLTDFEVTIRLHFDAFSYLALCEKPSFLDTIIETFLRDDLRFKLHFNAIKKWGKESAHGITYFARREEERGALRKLLERASEAGLGSSQVPQLSEEGKAGASGYEVCYAARANAFVIRADGSVSKCTLAFEDERNVVGKLTKDGDLIIDHDRHMPWLRGLVLGDNAALACPAVGHIW